MYDVPHTEYEALQLLALRNEFWHKLGQLTAEILAQMPEVFHDDQLMMLQDLASLYGSDYGTYLAKLKPPPRKGWAPPESCAARLSPDRGDWWVCAQCARSWDMKQRPAKCGQRN